MITEKDLQEAIAECQGQRNPNSSTCIKLAAFLIIQRELYGNKENNAIIPEIPKYSYANDPSESIVKYESDSEFSKIINGKNEYDVFSVMDELMEMLKLLYPKIYDSVMRKL